MYGLPLSQSDQRIRSVFQSVYNNALYFCKAVPHAVVFVVVFQVYTHYFILKFNCNEFDEKPISEVIRNWLNFSLRSFLCQVTLMTKNSGCSFL